MEVWGIEGLVIEDCDVFVGLLECLVVGSGWLSSVFLRICDGTHEF